MKPEDYRKQQRGIAAKSESRINKLFALSTLAGGLYTVTEFLEMAASSVAVGNVLATLRADRFMSSLLNLAPLGLGRPLNETARIERSLNTILETSDEPMPRIERLARAEPLSAAQGASREVMLTADVTHYFWKTDADPCQLCAHLANSMWPTTKAGITHPGCSCILLPVTEGMNS